MLAQGVGPVSQWYIRPYSGEDATRTTVVVIYRWDDERIVKR